MRYPFFRGTRFCHQSFSHLSWQKSVVAFFIPRMQTRSHTAGKHISPLPDEIWTIIAQYVLNAHTADDDWYSCRSHIVTIRCLCKPLRYLKIQTPVKCCFNSSHANTIRDFCSMTFHGFRNVQHLTLLDCILTVRDQLTLASEPLPQLCWFCLDSVFFDWYLSRMIDRMQFTAHFIWLKLINLQIGPFTERILARKIAELLEREPAKHQTLTIILADNKKWKHIASALNACTKKQTMTLQQCDYDEWTGKEDDFYTTSLSIYKASSCYFDKLSTASFCDRPKKRYFDFRSDLLNVSNLHDYNINTEESEPIFPVKLSFKHNGKHKLERFSQRLKMCCKAQYDDSL